MYHSGWKVQDYIKEAETIWETIEGRPFKYGACAEVLYQLPKFDPMAADEEKDGDKNGNGYST